MRELDELKAKLEAVETRTQQLEEDLAMAGTVGESEALRAEIACLRALLASFVDNDKKTCPGCDYDQIPSKGHQDGCSLAAGLAPAKENLKNPKITSSPSIQTEAMVPQSKLVSAPAASIPRVRHCPNLTSCINSLVCNTEDRCIAEDDAPEERGETLEQLSKMYTDTKKD